jgi:hypothetical protein
VFVGLDRKMRREKKRNAWMANMPRKSTLALRSLFWALAYSFFLQSRPSSRMNHYVAAECWVWTWEKERR